MVWRLQRSRSWKKTTVLMAGSISAIAAGEQLATQQVGDTEATEKWTRAKRCWSWPMAVLRPVEPCQRKVVEVGRRPCSRRAR